MAAQQPPNAAPPALTSAPGIVQDNPGTVSQPGQQPANPLSLSSTASSTSNSSNSGTPSSTQSHLAIPNTAPAGGILITQPAPGLGGVAGTPMYKLQPTGNPANASANWIVFGWNMTDVYEPVRPTSLTLRAGCENGYTYPVGAENVRVSGTGSGGSEPSNTFLLPDQSGKIPGTQSVVTWDVVQYASQHPNVPVPEGLCTLQIADDSRGFGADRRAGYLSPNNAAVTFALYTGEAYLPIASGGMHCLECKSNSAIMNAYDAHPVAISLWITLAICLLSGVTILSRGSYASVARRERKVGYGQDRVGGGGTSEAGIEAEESVASVAEIMDDI